MAAGEEKNRDFYAVLELKKECSDAELRNSYKKLAMKWHPDKCSASGSSRSMEESKEKFQEIQKAYSVLSDSNKRFLYDVGVYDNDDDNDNKGMGDFLGEMAQMMNQNRPNEHGGQESFEELQQLFVELFQDDLGTGFGGTSYSSNFADHGDHAMNSRHDQSAPDMSSATAAAEFGCSGGGSGSNKRVSSAMNSDKSKLDEFSPSFGSFCHGSDDQTGQSTTGSGGGGSSSKRRHGRKQKLSSRHDVSSYDTERF